MLFRRGGGWLGGLPVAAEVHENHGEGRGEHWRYFVPDMVRLGEAMEQEEGRSRAGFEAVDLDCGGDSDVEFSEAGKHLDL